MLEKAKKKYPMFVKWFVFGIVAAVIASFPALECYYKAKYVEMAVYWFVSGMFAGLALFSIGAIRILVSKEKLNQMQKDLQDELKEDSNN